MSFQTVTSTAVALALLLLPVPTRSDEPNVVQHARTLASAYSALQQGNAESAQNALKSTELAIRGTPYRLLRSLAAADEPKQAIKASAVAKPDGPFALAVLNPAEPRVAYLGDNGVVTLFDLSNPRTQAREIASSRGTQLTYGRFSADASTFIAGDAEGGIIVFNTVDWKEKAVYSNGDRPVRYVDVDGDGQRLLAETESGVVLWDIANDRQVGVVAQRYRFGTAICFSNDKQYFATGGSTSVLIHDAATGEVFREIEHAPYTMQLCFSPDGKYIASGLRGSVNKWLGVFEVTSGKRVFDRASHDKGVTGLVFLDNSKCLLSTSADGTMKFWHIPSGTELLAMDLGASIYQPTVGANGTIILFNQRGGPRYFLVK